MKDVSITKTKNNDMDYNVWIDKDQLLSEFRRELRAWKNIINEGIKCDVPVAEVIRDDERHHGRALGFLVALEALPQHVFTDADIDDLRKELVATMHSTKALIEVYKNE